MLLLRALRRASIIVVVCGAVLATLAPASAAPTGGAGGPLTDRTSLSFTGTKYTSTYHLYAAGLDWSKPVGLLIYADGTGEYGLDNPGSTYLLAGTNGLVNVARRHNMVLLAPMSPNQSCECWHTGDPTGYAEWLQELAQRVKGQYNIDMDRFGFGGYSTSAQLATGWFTPRVAQDIGVTDGVTVAISYGRPPAVSPSPAFTATFKNGVHMNWNVGDQDAAAYTGSYGAVRGRDWYAGAGFQTSLDVIAGLGHSRRDFASVMDAQIREHVPTAG